MTLANGCIGRRTTSHRPTQHHHPTQGSHPLQEVHYEKRSFKIDVEHCANCGGRMKLRALVMTPSGIERYLRWLGESVDPPTFAPARDPPLFKSQVIHRRLGEPAQAELFHSSLLRGETRALVTPTRNTYAQARAVPFSEDTRRRKSAVVTT